MSIEQAKDWLAHTNEKTKKGEGFFFAVCGSVTTASWAPPG